MNVLLMAYGTPYAPEEVEPYYTDIRRGRRPSEELLKELAERYEAIGKSPLNEITLAQAVRPTAPPGSTWGRSTGTPPSGRRWPPCTRTGCGGPWPSWPPPTTP